MEEDLGCLVLPFTHLRERLAHLTGEAFCEVPTCRLFNARRQEELIRSQCSEEAGLCPRHEAFFRHLREAADE